MLVLLSPSPLPSLAETDFERGGQKAHLDRRNEQAFAGIAWRADERRDDLRNDLPKRQFMRADELRELIPEIGRAHV